MYTCFLTPSLRGKGQFTGVGWGWAGERLLIGIFVAMTFTACCDIDDTDVVSVKDVLPYDGYEEYTYAPNNEITGDYDHSRAVKCKSGTYVGWKKDGVYNFYGMPFAQQPLGEKRWVVPQPLPASDKVYEAYHFSHAALQVENNAAGPYAQGEDMFGLNVWTSSINSQEKKPVMIYVYGGAFTAGGGSAPLLNGRNLVKNHPEVIVVSFNYRINLLGHLDPRKMPGGDDPKYAGGNGNLATRDQIAAIDWVRENISGFGGDPDNITLFGGSAGSTYCGALAISPLMKDSITGKPKVKNIIRQSLGMNLVINPDITRLPMEKFIQSQGYTSMADLEKASSEELLDLWKKCSSSGVACAPNNDGEVIPADPVMAWQQGAAADINMLQGIQSCEADFFKGTMGDNFENVLDMIEGYWEQSVDPANLTEFKQLEQQYHDIIIDEFKAKGITLTKDDIRFKKEIMNDWLFLAPMNIESKGQYTQSGTGKSYFYCFDYTSDVLKSKGLEACHAYELPFVLQNTYPTMWSQSSEELEVSNLLQTVWTNFAKTGSPSFNTTVNGTIFSIDWPQYSSDGREVVFLDLTPSIVRNFHKERADVLEKMLYLSPTLQHSEFCTGLSALYGK